MYGLCMLEASNSRKGRISIYTLAGLVVAVLFGAAVLAVGKESLFDALLTSIDTALG